MARRLSIHASNKRRRALDLRSFVGLLVVAGALATVGCGGDPATWSCSDFKGASAEEKKTAIKQLTKKFNNRPGTGDFRGNNMDEVAMEAALGNLIDDLCAKTSKRFKPVEPALEELEKFANGERGAPSAPPAATPSPTPSPEGTTQRGAQAPTGEQPTQSAANGSGGSQDDLDGVQDDPGEPSGPSVASAPPAQPEPEDTGGMDPGDSTGYVPQDTGGMDPGDSTGPDHGGQPHTPTDTTAPPSSPSGSCNPHSC